MKNLKLLLALPALVAIQSVFAQTGTHLKLSDQYPAVGEKITLTYDPAGTAVDGKKDITASAIFLDNKDYPAADIDLKPDGKLLTGEITIPANAKAFFVKIEAGDQVDNNGEKGYVYMIYKDKQPVEGAYAMEGYFLASGMGAQLAKIKSDQKEGAELYKKEFALYPKSADEYGSYYYYLVGRNPDHKAEIEAKIASSEKSSDEKDMMLAMQLYSSMGQTTKSDSLAKIIKGKFPNGKFVQQDMMVNIYKEKDIHKKDSLFTVYATKYPENLTDKSTSLDNLKSTMAWTYLKEADMDNYTRYEKQIKNKSIMIGYWNNVAWNWAVAGQHLAEAEKISRQAVDLIADEVKNPVASAYNSPKQAKKNALSSYNANADTYAYILWKENKSAEALPYMKEVYDRTSDEANSSEHYAQILAGVGQYEKAMEIISKSMKGGQNSAVLKEELKKDYVKVKGSDTGYDKYLAELETASKEKLMANMAKTMIKQPAPTFTLTDLDGKAVSLADLKGKVVIIDFWATWCGPCKASFPGMQMAVNKFKDNPNVKFLFVDCWENGDQDKYIDGVKKFIGDNKYTFHVLVDDKGDDGRQSKVVSTYKVDGIPTKFVIDKNGNIRFKYVGYSGSSDAVLSEVSNMIELAANPDAVAATVSKPEAKSK